MSPTFILKLIGSGPHGLLTYHYVCELVALDRIITVRTDDLEQILFAVQHLVHLLGGLKRYLLDAAEPGSRSFGTLLASYAIRCRARDPLDRNLSRVD